MLDKFKETAITWDKANRKVYEPLRVSAGDNKGRKLSVQVVNGGVIEDLSGASLSLFWETKDKAYKGLDAFDPVDATKGEFEIYYTTGMLSNEGTLDANLVLVDTSGRVVSEPFTITVFKGIDDDAIQSSDSFTALTEALIDISDLEQNYAPRLSTLEQNDVSFSQQLQQTEQELSSQLAETTYLLKSSETLQEGLDKGYSSILVQNRELTISSSVVIPSTTKKIIFINSTITRSQTLKSETNYPVFNGSNLNALIIEGVEFIGDNFKSSDGGANVSGHSSIFMENSRNIRVKDCTFLNTGLYGIEFYNCDNVIAENNFIESTQETDGTRGRYGVAFIKSRQCVARNNTLKYISVGVYSGLRGTDGVYYQDVKDIIIEQNHFISNTENAIYGEGYKGLKIINNTFIDSRSVGLKIRGIDVTVSNNIIQTNRTAINISVLSQNVVVTGNVIEMLPSANDNMGVILSMSGLSDYLSVRTLDTSLRGTDFIISNNTIKATDGDIPNVCHGVFISGDSSYTTVGDRSLQNIVIESNIMVGLKNGVYIDGSQSTEKITIKNNKITGLSPTTTDTYDYNGVGVYYGSYSPNLVVENNVIERFYNGLVFNSSATSFALCTILNNVFRDNTNYGVDYEKSFSGVASHKSEGNTFHSNGVGRVNNPPLQSARAKTLVGTSETGTAVFAANDKTLGKNVGFISLIAEDGSVVQVPYWVVINPT